MLIAIMHVYSNNNNVYHLHALWKMREEEREREREIFFLILKKLKIAKLHTEDFLVNSVIILHQYS